MEEVPHEEYEKQEEYPRVSTYWWVRQIILVAIAGFYLVFGIQLLVYDPVQRRPVSGLYLPPGGNLPPNAKQLHISRSRRFRQAFNDFKRHGK